MTPRAFVVALALASSAIAQRSQPDALADLRRAFLAPPDDSRIMMRWWWFGPAVTKPQLERELWLMKDSRIGGVEVQPVYPVALDDPEHGIKNLTFLSDEFVDALRFTGDKARELGMRVDVTLGSGWPYGGPQVGIDAAAGKLRIERGTVRPGVRRVPVPGIGTGERLIAVFLTNTDPSAATTELTDVRDGAVHLPAAFDVSHDVQFFIASRSGMMVKRPAVGARRLRAEPLRPWRVGRLSGTRRRSVAAGLWRAASVRERRLISASSIDAATIQTSTSLPTRATCLAARRRRFE